MEYSDFKIKNCMEDVVLQNVDQVLKDYGDICKCEQCRCDIIALTLNEMPPRYVVSTLGETYTKTKVLDIQFKVDIFTAISKAVDIVKNNPRHDHNKG